MAGSNNQDGSPRMLQTVLMSQRVIETLTEHDGIGVTELSRVLDISKSTAYSHLKTLEKGGFVVKRDGQYELAFKFLAIGEYVRNQSVLFQIGKPEVDKLSAETGQYTHLVVEENGRGVNLYKARGETAVGDQYQAAKLQQRDRLHYTASGKAILAHLPRTRVEEIIDTQGLPARTSNTITDPDHLFDELAAISERGFARNDEEEIEGLRAVGAPIQRADGRVLGSLSVSGPTSIMTGDTFHEEIPDLVTRTANIIEVNINMSDRSSELITLE